MAPGERYPVANATVYDVETYPNCALFAFREPDGTVCEFVTTPDKRLDAAILQVYVAGRLLVGFNSNAFDDGLLANGLDGSGCEELHHLATRIIGNHQLDRQPPLSIDLMQVLGGPRKAGSLKLIAARTGFGRIEELPFDPAVSLSPAQIETVRQYCRNDLEVTAKLYGELSGELAVRQHLSNRYKLDIRSHSDASVASAVMCAECTRRTGLPKKCMKAMVGKPASVRYQPPAWTSEISHPETKAWLAALDRGFEVGSDGKVKGGTKQTLRIAGKSYTRASGAFTPSTRLACFDLITRALFTMLMSYPTTPPSSSIEVCTPRTCCRSSPRSFAS